MIQSAILLLRELEEKLSLVTTQGDIVHNAEKAIHIIEDHLHGLRDLFARRPENHSDEIEFYKNISPKFYAHLIYFIRLYRIESALPTGNRRGRRKLLKEEQKLIERYFLDHDASYRYFKSANPILDGDLFVYQKRRPLLYIDETVGLADHHLCTPTGLTFARFMAYERLQDYLSEALDSTAAAQKKAAPKFSWTSNKVDLVELVYALCYGRAINNGKLEVKELADFFSSSFGVDLSNIYRSKQEMYSRRNTTVFLDFLKKKFREGMDDADDRNNN